MFIIYDGHGYNVRSTSRRRWLDGRENHSRYADVSTSQIENGRIRLFESYHHVESRFVFSYSNRFSPNRISYENYRLTYSFFGAANGENSELEAIQDRYMTCLKTFMEHTNPQQPTRLRSLLDRMPEVSYFRPNGQKKYIPCFLSRTFR